MLTREQYYQLMHWPEENSNEKTAVKWQAFGPGQLNTYSRFIEDIKNSFITYPVHIKKSHKNKIILSDTCLSSIRPINQNLLALLNAMLAYSLTNESSLSKRGVLLEGEVGAGKSTLLKTLIEKYGFVHEAKAPFGTPTHRQYLEITVIEPEMKGSGVSSTSEFAEQLIQAFHEGKRVIINELNLDAGLEILLNQLLNGYDPAGNPAKTKGFRIYASQNPNADENKKPQSKGRRPQSLALKNRLHVHYVSPLSKTGLENLAEYNDVPDPLDFARACFDAKNQNPEKVTIRTIFQAMEIHARNKPEPDGDYGNTYRTNLSQSQ